MKKKIIIFTMMIFALILSACSEDSDNRVERERAIPVEITEAKIEDFIVEKIVQGRVEPKDLTPIMIPMPGEVTELEVENGDIVKEDDLIAKITTQAGARNINAPADGEIVQLSAREESIVTETEPLALILDLDELTITFAVTNNVRVLFKDEKSMKAQVDGKTYDIEINTIGKLPNDTGLYPIEATIKNKDENVLPGMIAVIALPEKRVKNAIVLPTEAIVEESEGAFVYRVEDDQVTKIEVTIVETQTDLTAIEGDIKEGDHIVINGQLTLSDGSKVVIMKEGNES